LLLLALLSVLSLLLELLDAVDDDSFCFAASARLFAVLLLNP
jgi:hypothetical protein